MKVLDYEKAVLSVIFRNPKSEEMIPENILSILSDDKFGENGDAHKFIYRGVERCVVNNEPPTISNVAVELGEFLEVVGGRKYLESLFSFLPAIGEQTPLSWKTFAKVVNRAGRLRHLGLIIDQYASSYKDFDKLVEQLNTDEEVDNFLNNFLTSMNREIEGLDTGYQHISHFIEKEVQKLRRIKDGDLDVEEIGFPSLKEFGIPWSPSFGVIIGLRSSGKTQAALQMGLGKAMELKQTGKPGSVYINSLETSGELLSRRLACCMAKVDSKLVRLDKLSTKEQERYNAALRELEFLPIHINDNPLITTGETTMHAIASNLRDKRVMGISDYAELFADSAGSEEQRVASVTRNIKAISGLTGSIEIMISQVNNNVIHKPTKVAGLENARYSGAIGHAADWAIEVWNPVYMLAAHFEVLMPDETKSKEKAYWLIEKNKNGPLGDIELNWYPEHTRFDDQKVPIGTGFGGFSKVEEQKKIEPIDIFKPGELPPDF